MSELQITAVTIDEILPHPNAERLDLIRIGAYTVCEQRGKYSVGDIVAHFPPDILIPNTIAKQLGVEGYLKDAIYPGDAYKSKCRVAAIRLRGCASFGFLVPTRWAAVKDDNLTARFHGVKFEPNEPAWYKQGECATRDPRFHEYTDIENFRNANYTDAIPDGTPVRVTEKIHGSNSRVGIIDGEYMCGSHNCAKKEAENSPWWAPLTEDMKAMLNCISEGGHNVIAFGEIFGSKVQFMDYGVIGNGGYLLFDISVDGQYLNWEQVKYYATRFCIPVVPLLYEGPFSRDLVDKLVDGPTVVTDEVHSTFKGREGIVITPLEEAYSKHLGGRMILKAVSVDYLEKRKSDSH
jgi:RNA ligase (TIGR02306 family)